MSSGTQRTLVPGSENFFDPSSDVRFQRFYRGQSELLPSSPSPRPHPAVAGAVAGASAEDLEQLDKHEDDYSAPLRSLLYRYVACSLCSP
jgi:hypothetical protein